MIPVRNSPILPLCAVALFAMTASPAVGQEVIVIGNLDDAIEWLKTEGWWGEAKRGDQLRVPHAMITGISPRWRETAQSIPVAEKKEIFYRFMLPLVMHANTMVLDRRARLTRLDESLAAGERLSAEDLGWLRLMAVLLRITDKDTAATLGNSAGGKLREVIKEALYKLDVIPPGLALGQAAYESGYGTSRFAAEGNALFGQWTWEETHDTGITHRVISDPDDPVYRGSEVLPGLVPGDERRNAAMFNALKVWKLDADPGTVDGVASPICS